MSKTFPRGLFRSTSKIGVASACLGLTAALFASGCLERPVKKIEPNTSNFFVQKIINQEIDKIDLLFVIDNSVSMADKQAILEKAVPKMVDRLVTPDCINEETEARSAPVAGECPAGTTQEFKPVNNIHIGVITSSIGGHGSPSCRTNENSFTDGQNEHTDDRALLIPKVRTKINTLDADIAVPVSPHSAEGFLVWRPKAIGTEGEPGYQPPGESDPAELSKNFAQHVVAAWEHGCGFEAPLEAWYRFLVDPSPPVSVELMGSVSASTGPDQQILDQRAAFLRGDSLVAVIVLTDENDCSAMDGGGYYANAGFGWLLSDTTKVFKAATSACAVNPNDPCCYSCFNTGAPEECKNEAIKGECAAGATVAPENDAANMRCFDNKRRFGFDLLYPTQRYVDGLTKSRIIDTHPAQPEEVDNPLLVSKDGQQRDPGFVFFAGIVGIPWQDLATDETLNDPDRLEFLKANQLTKTIKIGDKEVDRWSIILGQPGLPADSKECLENPKNPLCLSGKKASNGQTCAENPGDASCLPVRPLDPFMIESIVPREAGLANPIVPDEKIIAVGDAGFNKINGREWNTADPGTASGLGVNADLQYACIFSLVDFGGVRDCADGSAACDCTDGVSRPLCDGTTQNYGKAYPGSRVLQVLRDFGDNAIVASICPKVADEANADFGYNPAVAAIVDRLAEKLGGQCLPRKVAVEDGKVPCRILEAINPKLGTADCSLAGRQVPGASDEDPADSKKKLEAAVRDQLDELELCGESAGSDCDQWQMCEIKAVSEEASETSCLNDKDYAGTEAGYCYIDPAQGLGSDALVQQCDATKRQQLRFVTNDDNLKIPLKTAVTFVACTADQFSE